MQKVQSYCGKEKKRGNQAWDSEATLSRLGDQMPTQTPMIEVQSQALRCGATGERMFLGADAEWMIQIPETDLPGGMGTPEELGKNWSQAGPCPGMSRKVYAPGVGRG